MSHPVLRVLVAMLLVSAAARAQGENILIFIADDMSPNLIGAYLAADDEDPDDGPAPVTGHGPSGSPFHVGLDGQGQKRITSHIPSYNTGPRTPRIDALAQQGVLFQAARAYSRCSPTRATVLTGRYGFHTGIGANVNVNLPEWSVQFSETTLPETFAATHATACFGKWHLATNSVGGDLAPNLAGYEHFSGFIQPLRLVEDYFEFDKVVDGATVHVVNYRPSEMIDDAIGWIASVDEPWLCVVNFHLPHWPYHSPPAHLHSLPGPAVTVQDQVHAMVEAMDTEMGRLMDSLSPGSLAQTTIFFMGDNGRNQKGTLYEGGVRVPFIVAGSAVSEPGRMTRGLVDTVDIHATAAAIAGLDVSGLGLDSTSFLPYLANLPPESSAWARVRAYSFTERFQPNGPVVPLQNAHRAVTDKQYKLIRRPTSEEFYYLRTDPHEEIDLLANPERMTAADWARYDELSAALTDILDS